ncbi:MAG: thymidylate synthase [Bacilli bacterium]|nr:thymidylate synthase [Bacilli bacterium]
MTKGDKYTKEIFERILEEGCWDKNPRPHYEDEYEGAVYDPDTNTIITADNEVIEVQPNQTVHQRKDKVLLWTPAHTLSINDEVQCTYDLSKGESPFVTLRPIAVRKSIAEILWIYQKESNDLVEFDELLGECTWDQDHKINNWWDEWALRDENGDYILNEKGHPHIGSTYGEVIRKHNLVKKRLKEMKENPDSRRHIISMWQDDDYDLPHGLKPCAFMSIWNVRHGRDGKDYLDMTLIQRSSDFATAGCINQVQYMVLLLLFARHLDLTPGKFTWKPVNVQIYDRHMDQVKEMLGRDSVECAPYIELNPDKKDFYDFTPADIQIKEYPFQKIKTINPQLTFPLGI